MHIHINATPAGHHPARRSSRSIVGLLAAAVAFGGCSPADGEAAFAQVPGAVEADPAHYSVEFENDEVRVLRIRYGPGESSPMHYHPANCAVQLAPTTWRMTDQSGAVTEMPSAVGDASCNDAEAHAPTNAGSGAAELVLIEFKGREQF